jgi:nitronate monooxygenase
MSAKVPDFSLAASAIDALKQAAETNNCSDFSALWCVQNTTGCKEISAATLTIELTPDNY